MQGCKVELLSSNQHTPTTLAITLTLTLKPKTTYYPDFNPSLTLASNMRSNWGRCRSSRRTWE